VANPLLEKELFRMVEKRLAARGLVRDEENPQLLITMSSFVGRREDYVPPKTITTTRIQQVWSASMVGFNMTGQYVPVPVTETQTVPGRKVVSYYRNIRLNFFDYARLQRHPKIPPLVWIGIAESQGSSSDIRDVAPVMLSELLWEFPKKTGRERHRMIKRVSLGALGILVDPEDWWWVVKVFPGTPAAAAGLRPGDRILKVDGKRTVNGRYILERKGKGAYRARSPYFKYVLANLHGREVELLVKSAVRDPKTGKKKHTVRLRPIHLTAYHYVNPANGFFTQWCPWNVRY
jgi:Periplasmic protease